MASVDASIVDVDYEELERLWQGWEPELARRVSLQAVAPGYIDALYAEFGHEIVLARMFGTVDYRFLPPDDRASALHFAQARGVSTLGADTPVLSLLATRGSEPEWNDRTRSRDHRAIPLVSPDFIDCIPMIARLLREMGFRDAPGTTTADFVTMALANLNGVFYVPDAGTTRDAQERLVIPAIDFVAAHGVRSVFGFGGSYVSGVMFLTAIIFLRETIDRPQAVKFVPMIGSIKSLTTRMVNRGAIFDG